MEKTLKALLERLEYTIVLKGCFTADEEALRLLVPAVVSDDRNLSKGCLFICCRITNHNGSDSIGKAIEAGASVIVTEPGLFKEYLKTAKEKDHKTVVIFTEDTRYAMAVIYAAWYGYPAEKMKVVGITGTNGKTTTAYMLYSILTKAGFKTGLIGTIECIIGEEHIPSRNTTPEAPILQKMLRDMAQIGTQIVVMEVSSQALLTHRSQGFVFEFGIFTNIGEDHIGNDQCRNFEHYLHCKSLLMQQCRTGIVNRDDPYVEAILKNHTCKVRSFGLSEQSDLRGTKISFRFIGDAPGVEFETAGMHIRMPMPGVYSVYNALAASQAALELHAPKKSIVDALQTIRVKGRAEVVRPVSCRKKRYPAVIVDYAHNGMSIRELLKALKAYYSGKVTCVAGAAGVFCIWRSIGQACGEFADFTVVTSDNYGEDDPEEIVREMTDGIREMNGAFTVIPDRREAVRYGVTHADPDDLVVICGRGHEIGLKINGRNLPLPNDIALAQEAFLF